MKIVIISDTHGFHRQLNLCEGDMIIHAGDVSGRGLKSQVVDFLDWFEVQPFRYKVLIAGNHDLFFEQAAPEEILEILPANITYLNDSGTNIEGLNIWGSPVSAWYYDWAFSRQQGRDIQKHWELIPQNTDILITHGPPLGILDKIHDNLNVGCETLMTAVKHIQPKLHVFGHVHKGYGLCKIGETTYVNACILNEDYHTSNAPIVIEL